MTLSLIVVFLVGVLAGRTWSVGRLHEKRYDERVRMWRNHVMALDPPTLELQAVRS